MKTIVFTGGGSAGHVIPNVALIPKLQRAGWTALYIGSESGIERQIIEGIGNIPYYPISTGKLRRYFDLKNLKDPFKVVHGVYQAHRLLRKIKPAVVFSKGGFVSVPVILASRLNGIPSVIHESDITPGLANKLSIPFASKVCVTFPETLKYIRTGKAVHTGSPIREEIFRGNASQGRKFCGFQEQKPVLLVMGGSLGSQKINQMIRGSLDSLLPTFQIAHICGQGNIDESLTRTTGYKQFEYIGQELPDLFALADLAVSRAGANVIFELLALSKPMLLIPLSKQVSRGDQILNAESFESSGYARVLPEEAASSERLSEEIKRLYEQRDAFSDRMKQNSRSRSLDQIIDVIEQAATLSS